jgi:hypothetical protein
MPNLCPGAAVSIIGWADVLVYFGSTVLDNIIKQDPIVSLISVVILMRLKSFYNLRCR